MSSGSKKSGSPPKPPGPDATKEELLKYLLRPIELDRTRVRVLKPLKPAKTMPLKATLPLDKMSSIKEASSQDEKVIQDKNEDTKHSPSTSK